MYKIAIEGQLQILPLQWFSMGIPGPIGCTPRWLGELELSTRLLSSLLVFDNIWTMSHWASNNIIDKLTWMGSQPMA